MEFIFRLINEEDANNIISYKHGNDYPCFDREKHSSDIDSLLNSESVDFFVALDEEGDMIGFSEVTFDEDGIMEMSGALLPDYVGEGLGFDFLTQCIEFVVDYYDYGESYLKTLIKPSEHRAIRVLERIGFQMVEESDEWIEMSLDL